MQQTHYNAYSIWIHFDKLYVLQTWLTKTFPSDFQNYINKTKLEEKKKRGYLNNGISLDLFI